MGVRIPPGLFFEMDKQRKLFLTGVSILVGTSIGAGVLGIPYVAAQSGFFVALGYIVALGLIILTVNLYLGEITLRTKEDHQIAGYSKKYLGKTGMFFTEFATVFGIYAAIVAYMLGIGISISFLVFGDSSYVIPFGAIFGLMMSGLLWRGVKSLKRFEKIGVTIILLLLALIFFIFIKDVNISNLYYFNVGNIFLPFGVILFALLSFHAVPEVRLVLHKDKKLMKKILMTGTLISVIFYILFAFVVVGLKGGETPEIATLALGSIFVFLGIFTMFTSYLALGNALIENLMFDERFRKKKAWFLTAIIPIFIFLIIELFANEFFSFTKLLGIGGVVSGGLIGILVLLMVKQAKQKGDRKPEYNIPINWFIIGLLSFIFIAGIVFQIISSI